MKFVMLAPVENNSPLALPLFLETVSCGFPSPAQDYVEKELDLNDYCVRHRSATYYLRAHGDSMQDGFLFNGDLLVVDSAVKPINGDIVVAGIGAEFTVKRLITHPRLCLHPMNPAFPPIYPDPDELQIFGVVTHIIHRTREVMKCLD
ncbi:translesion error-prone DNA polymerase V autoproteolytic subunit [Salmonella enterica subsp. enterica serovar Typhimurium]|nr:translesion error-prone DNA polymerase V autoproteolytic subunit [Salmonella enterica subsp. enterica serovar Typhimurium]EIF3374601.1 translesion error-prone DNA polymerase V autoproteolytic subunit [Salmonella enterica subsp. enterica serovar Typhimurium]EII7208620.1 translesion error-prone DNA polymerase V autoproteolytic subunit [Salmonella enterica subsp. enterica serovar Typhimurium]EIP0078545.1 translesion error-prone DNA polymerase V autoproteolytic subunit [Salmonella enterica subsp.